MVPKLDLDLIMMYSEDNEILCAYCEYSEPCKGVPTHSACSKLGGYVPNDKPGCEHYRYDIFKRPVHRKRALKTNKYKAEDFEI